MAFKTLHIQPLISLLFLFDTVVECFGFNGITAVVSALIFALGSYFVSYHWSPDLHLVFFLSNYFRMLAEQQLGLYLFSIDYLHKTLVCFNCFSCVCAVLATGFTTISHNQPSNGGCCTRILFLHFLVLVVGCNSVSCIYFILVGSDCCCSWLSSHLC